VAGSVYALSTVGSIIGTFLPVLALIPAIGTRSTFLLFSLLLLVTSLVGLARASRRLALSYAALLLIVIGLGAFLRGGSIKPIPGLVYEAESPYNYIQVIRRGQDLYLALNEGQALHSWYNPNAILADGVWDYFLLAPYFAPNTISDDVRSLAIIGLAGGTVARQYTAVYGPIPIEGVEIDPQIVEIGRRYFDMHAPNLKAVVGDGRYWLQTVDRRYDVIAIDAYQQPYVPFHLTTVEFFQQVRGHLADNGVAVINSARTPTDFRLVDALASTMAQVFPSVYVIDVPGTFNSLIVATVRPSRLTDYADNVVRLQDPRLLTVAQRAAGHIRAHHGQGLVFTDDRAPVEHVVDQIILGYVLAAE
jgi:spermidine synthase